MPDKQTTTHCVARLLSRPGLAAATLPPSQALRQDAGRRWTDLVTLHAQARAQGRWLRASDRAQGRWLRASDRAQATKGAQYAVHSQRVHAHCQHLAATVATAP